MFDLRQLRYFVAVAEAGHVGRAAERLHLSQPPLSRQIRQLEANLGVSLFHRHARGVSLTEAGERLLLDAQDLLAAAEAAATTAQRTARGELGRLRLGFASTALYSILPALVRRLGEGLPAVTLELRELTAEQQFHALAGGTLDAGIVICADPPAPLDRLPLLAEPLVACLPAQHPLAAPAGTTPLPLATLRDEPFILFPRVQAPALHDRILALGQQAGFTPRLGQQGVQMQTIVGLVSAGLGVALVPASMAGLRRPGVCYRAIEPAGLDLPTELVWQPAGLRPVTARLIELAREAAAG